MWYISKEIYDKKNKHQRINYKNSTSKNRYKCEEVQAWFDPRLVWNSSTIFEKE